jgi:ELWxxDGT repeat protein
MGSRFPSTKQRRRRRKVLFGRSLRLEWLEERSLLAANLVADIAPLGNADPHSITLSGGKTFFVASDRAAGAELWRTDGTQSGTVRVKDIDSGVYGSYPTNLTDVSGTLFFTARDGSLGYELWKSDGTELGTVLVKDIRSGSYGSAPHSLTAVGTSLFFVAADGTNGYELWKSDGSSTGTVLVKDIR